ncbi:VPS28-domain-containing protein [Acrodontium crateriforme]|uniref:VPS28-domain-containing protein n=1 Tax=Acrodontium crateriforme TaxID=150365 RepID=A0AAQ3RE99_9PEZI|nr:VPS28-domain-containing protein [Acrodontium crateriforme]
MYAQQLPQQLAYAPTPYSYTPSSNLTATINLDQEVKLADNAAERDLYESLAEIYGIIITLDALEKAYLRDSIKESEYTETCDRLLRQYRSNLADDTVSAAFGSLEHFKAEWDLEVPKATERLKIGLPSTVEQAPSSHHPRTASQQPVNNLAATYLVSASENFITLFDAIRMNMLSKDTLHPILVEIIQAVNKVTDRDFENKGKIVQWLITLNQMRAAQELGPEQARELQFDLNAAQTSVEIYPTKYVPKAATNLHAYAKLTMGQSECFAQAQEEDEPLDVLDLPQLYTQPTAATLLSTLTDLSFEPPSWDRTPRSGTPRSGTPGAGTPTTASRKKPKVRGEGVPGYLTNIIRSRLDWIEHDQEKELIWESASQRLSERSGRTAMGAIQRTFTIPLNPTLAHEQNSTTGEVPKESDQCSEDVIDITLHEPALTADNLGLKTWASSFLLASRLCVLRSSLPKFDNENDNVLELGAGTGLVGLAAAAVLQKTVILTDLPEIVPNIKRNAEANLRALSERNGKVETAILDWSEPDQFRLEPTEEPYPAQSFRLILAADTVYSAAHPALFVQAVQAHLSKDRTARVVVEIPIRESFAAERQEFTDRMHGIGLQILDEGKEVGLDDWTSVHDQEQLAEVTCHWMVWGWA